MAQKTTSSPPTERTLQQLPSEDRLKEAAAEAEKALAAQNAANSLRKTASTFADPQKREKMLRNAFNKEVEAHGSSKKARMLQSGAFQGTISGAGIGGAVSLGLGTAVGTVVGGLTAIPATGLGALAGAGVGAIHGPFIKLSSLAGSGKEGGENAGDSSENVETGVDSANEDAVPDPVALRKAADLLTEEMEKEQQNSTMPKATSAGSTQERRKPRKLNRPRSSDSKTQHGSNKESTAKKKPRKIEMRTGCPQSITL